MDNYWIDAARAYEIVFSVSPSSAGDTICSRAYDGLVAARAKRLVIGHRVDDDCAMPTEFWWARGGTALEKNWAAGDFETWIDKRVHCRAYGVQFKRIDIEAILPAVETSSPSFTVSPSSTQSGGRRLSDRWPDWVAELVAVVHDEGIPVGVGSQGQEELIRRVADALASRGTASPARTTVQPVVQAVLDRLRRPRG